MSLPSSPFISSPRNLARLFAVGVLCISTCGSLTAQADNVKVAAKVYDVAMTFTTPAGKSTPRVRVRADEKFKVALDNHGSKLMASFVLTASGADAVKLDGTVECGKVGAAHPILLTRLGEAATVKLHDGGAPGCELTLLVSEAAMPAQ